MIKHSQFKIGGVISMDDKTHPNIGGINVRILRKKVLNSKCFMLRTTLVSDWFYSYPKSTPVVIHIEHKSPKSLPTAKMSGVGTNIRMVPVKLVYYPPYVHPLFNKSHDVPFDIKFRIRTKVLHGTATSRLKTSDVPAWRFMLDTKSTKYINKLQGFQTKRSHLIIHHNSILLQVFDSKHHKHTKNTDVYNLLDVVKV